MNKLIVTLFSICALTLFAGCNRTETPAETQADVSKAQMKGAENVAEEQREADKSMMNADSAKEMSKETHEGMREVAKAEAKAAHDVATEKCEAMTGDARSNCKKAADEEYKMAKDRADAMHPG